MYPLKPIDPCPSKLDPQDAVNLIHELIKTENSHRNSSLDCFAQTALSERMDVLKRQLTDYFLAADKRQGVYVKGPND